jgi:energy-coupling factor transporter transmembrane protein EcfT
VIIIKKKKNKGYTKFLLFIGGLISILFAYVLWYQILNLEAVFAILFFVAGIGKILFSIIGK